MHRITLKNKRKIRSPNLLIDQINVRQRKEKIALEKVGTKVLAIIKEDL